MYCCCIVAVQCRNIPKGSHTTSRMMISNTYLEILKRPVIGPIKPFARNN